MATRYWVGGANTWDATVGTKWAATSGGTGGASVPTAADDVFADAASGAANITFSASTVCRSFNCTGYTGTVTHPASTTINIGDGTAGAGNIALKFVAGMTLSVGSATTSIINFVSTNATQQAVITGGKTMPTINFNGVGGSWQLQDSLTLSQVASALVTLTNGSLDTNGQSLTAGGFFSNFTNIRSLSLGASVINLACNGSGGWNVNSTNLTFNAGTSSITVNTSNNGVVFGDNLTFNNFTIIYGNGSGTVSGSGVTINGNYVIQGGNQARFPLMSNIAVNGNLTMTGNSTVSMPIMYSNTNGQQRTISVQPTSTVSITNFNFQDIVISGANAPYATTYTGDAGGNGGMTLSSPRTLYFVGNGASSYMSTTAWSTSSGGASGNNPPLPQDLAIFDNLSITSTLRTITLNSQAMPTIDLSNVLNSPTINISNTNGYMHFFGDFIVKAGMSFSGTTPFSFRGKVDQVLDTKGITCTSGIRGYDILPTKKLKLGSDFVSQLSNTLGTNTASTGLGEFTSNGFNFTALAIVSGATAETKTITMTNTWTVTGTGTVFDMRGAGVTLNAGTSNLVVSDTSATAKSISRQVNQVLNDVTIPSGSGIVSFTNATASTINNLNVTGPAFVRFNSGGATYTWTGNWNFTSGPSAIVTIDTNVPGNAATMIKSSGVLAADYMSLKDNIASGGATFYSGRNSTIVSNVSGWTATFFGKKSLTDVYTVSETFTKQFVRVLTDTINWVTIFSRLQYKTILETLSLSETRINTGIKTMSESLTLADTFKRLPLKNLIDTISIVEIFTKLTKRSFSDLLTFVDSLLKGKVPQLPRYILKAYTPISVILKDTLKKVIIKLK